MNTEPPTGDDLQRMLVSMKHNVLEHADDRRPKRRGHRSGIVIAAVALLALGTASGAVALAVVPQMQQAAPVASPTPSLPEPSSTPSSAPVVETPDPTPEPTATEPPRRPYDPADPGTWTISGAEVGPIALGGDVDAELDDVGLAYDRTPADTQCPSPDTTFFERSGAVPLTVQNRDGSVTAVAVGLLSPVGADALDANPTTAEGVGISSTLADLRAAYPDLASVRNSDTGGSYSLWSVQRDGRFITFEMDESGDHVGLIWVGTTAEPPYEFCG
jgi:hypothetical protein